jgi:predicted CopG family antitoxin
MIRTTVAIREDVYENLKRLAFSQKKSLNEVVNIKLAGGVVTPDEAERKVTESMALFSRLAKKGKAGVDVVAAVRELRDRDICKM